MSDKNLYYPSFSSFDETAFPMVSYDIETIFSLDFTNTSDFFSPLTLLDPEENELFGETGRELLGYRLSAVDMPDGVDRDTAFSIRSDHVANLSIQSGYNSTSDAYVSLGTWDSTVEKWGVNGALRVDMSDNNSFSMRSNYGSLSFNNAGTGDITIQSTASEGSPTNRLTIDMDKLKIGTGSRYAEFQSLDTNAPALYFVNNDGDPPQPTDGAVIYAKDNDLYRRSSDGSVAIAAWGTGGGTGTIDETANYSMTGTWDFSPASGKSVPTFQPYAAGPPFSLGENAQNYLTNKVSHLNADYIDGAHADEFAVDQAGVLTQLVGHWQFNIPTGDPGNFPRFPYSSWFNQADGTAPFLVTSTTVVANLTAENSTKLNDVAASSYTTDSELAAELLNYANLSQDEAVTGDYTFSGDITVGGGGATTGSFTIAEPDGEEAPIILENPVRMGTIVTGLNVQYLNGYEDTSFIRPATPTVNFTGDWTFNPSGTLPFTVAAGKTDVVLRLNADLLDGNHAEDFLFPESSPVTISGNWTFLPVSGNDFPNLPKNTIFSQPDGADPEVPPFQVVSTKVVANLRSATTDLAANSTLFSGKAVGLFAILDEDEIVTGDYTFSGANTFSSTNTFTGGVTVGGGGSGGSFTIAAPAGAEAPIILVNPHIMRTIVTGLNVQYLNGVQESQFIRPATPTVEFTGDWTFNPSGTLPFTVADGKTDVVLRLNADLLDGEHASGFLQTSTTDITITGNWSFNPASGDNYPNLPKQTYFSESSLAPFQVVSTAVVANLHATNSDQLGGTWHYDYATDAEVASLLTGYANLSEDETVAGDYTFTGAVDLSPIVETDKVNVKSGKLEISAPVASEAPFKLLGTPNVTMVDGLNVQYLNGYQSSHFIRPATATVAVTGDWTFNPSGSQPFFVAAGKTDTVTNLSAEFLGGSPPETFLQVATATPIITGNWTFNPTAEADFPYFGTNSNPQFPSGTKFYVADGTAPFEVTSTTAVVNLHATNSDKLGGTVASNYATDAEVATLLTSYANLSEDETVAGDYGFTGDVTFGGGGINGSLTIGVPAGAEAPIILTTPSLTVVTGLNADYVDGIHGTDLANTAQSETVSGAWTFSTPPAFTQATGTPPFTVSSLSAVVNLRSATSEEATNSLQLGGVTAASYPRTNRNETLTSIWQFGNASNAVPISMAEMATPTEPATSFGYLYHNSADNGIYWMTHSTEGDFDTNLMATDASAIYSATATSWQNSDVEFLSIEPATDQTYMVEIRVVGRGTAGDFDNGYVAFRAFNMFYTSTLGVFTADTPAGTARTPGRARDGAGTIMDVNVSGGAEFIIPILIDGSGNIQVKAHGYNDAGSPNYFSWKYFIKVYQV